MVDTVAANNLPKPTMTDQGAMHVPTMKQPTSIPTFPYQHAEKSPHNQHDLSFNPILHVGTHHLQYRFFRTNTPKSHHTTNTICQSSTSAPTTSNTNFPALTSRKVTLSATRFVYPHSWSQPTKTPTFPHQHAEKSPLQQHVVSYNPHLYRRRLAD